MSLRETVQAELDRRGWSAYRLVQELAGRTRRDGKPVGDDTVYKFLAGTREITAISLEPILDLLGLEVRRKRR